MQQPTFDPFDLGMYFIIYCSLPHHLFCTRFSPQAILSLLILSLLSSQKMYLCWKSNVIVLSLILKIGIRIFIHTMIYSFFVFKIITITIIIIIIIISSSSCSSSSSSSSFIIKEISGRPDFSHLLPLSFTRSDFTFVISVFFEEE